MTRILAFLLAVSLSVLLNVVAQPATAADDPVSFKNEPDGFGQVKLDTNLKKVLEVYPQAQKVQPANEQEEKLQLTIYNVNEPQPVASTKCKLKLQFWKEVLTHIHFVECADKPAIQKYLTETYGSPSAEEKNYWIWKGRNTNITYSPLSSDFIIAHRAFSESFAATMFLESLRQGAAEKGAPAKP